MQRLPRGRRNKAALRRVILNVHPADRGHLFDMAKVFVQTTFPHADPGDVSFYSRRNGRMVLVVQQGVVYDPSRPDTRKKKPRRDDGMRPAGYPFGYLPRLLMVWITTEARETQRPVITFGKRFYEFLEAAGVGTDSRSLAAVREQLTRLSTCRVSIAWDTKTPVTIEHLNTFRGIRLWKPCNEREVFAEGSGLILSKSFFEDLGADTVPVDVAVLRYMAPSPLGIDLYFLLHERASRLMKPLELKWADLAEQVGAAYMEMKEFARKARKEIARIREVCPALRVEPGYGKIVLHPFAYSYQMPLLFDPPLN
ncbi:MAG: hypothetical protein D6806_15275 [Deltaproteobacteria bacterium]|nr:MAG: hypothetical protein D6806_15275 [Deltaproteobacteria bacterium]